MYAVIKNSIVIWYFVGTLEDAKTKYKDCQFIEMTKENSPAEVGDIWNGKQFIKGDKNA